MAGILVVGGGKAKSLALSKTDHGQVAEETGGQGRPQKAIVGRRRNVRTRYIEDIPEGITPVVTEHTIHRDWCPHCRRLVEPKVPDPNGT